MDSKNNLKLKENKFNLKFTFFFLFIFLLISFTSATSVGKTLSSDFTEDKVVYTPPAEIANVSLQNVNSSTYWDNLDTPADIFSNGMWTRLGSTLIPTNVGDDINTTGDLYVQNVFGDGIESYFNTTLLIDGHDTGSSSAALIVQGDLNKNACINLTEAGTFGFSICYDGIGHGRLQLSNLRTGDLYLNLDRISGNMTLYNDTILTGGNLEIKDDTKELYLGASNDVSTTFNSTDWIFNLNIGTVARMMFQNFAGYIFDNLVQISGDLNQTNGNATINNIYAGAFYHNHTATPLVFTDEGHYYNLFLTDSTDLNGFTFQGGFKKVSNLTAQVSGKYQLIYNAIGDGQNNHEYIASIILNGSMNTLKEECDTHKKLSAGGDIVTLNGNCIISIVKDDVISLVVSDDTGGAGNYYGANVNLVRIGDL